MNKNLIFTTTPMSQGSTSGMRQQCQHCNQSTHLADRCPFLHTNCKIPGCKGLRKLLISKTEKNPGRKFLKCHLTNCNGFEWLDHAIMASKGYAIPSQECYTCGEYEHWMKDCKWNSIPCNKEGCTGKRALRISTAEHSEGRRYLKCPSCKGFEWFSWENAHQLLNATPVPITPARVYEAKIVNEATVDGLCVRFETYISFK